MTQEKMKNITQKRQIQKKGHEHQRKKVETNTDLRLEIKELETLGCLIRMNL